jgi:hypothetical protein
MTKRTEANPPTPVELATADVVETIAHNAHHFHQEHAVQPRQHIDEKAFRRIIALYFFHKSLADWCHDLGIPDATDPTDRQEHGGEG